MKKFILLGCLFTGITALAQNSISGVITDATTNEPIAATIHIPQLEIGTMSDLEGSYTIEGIPDGSFNILVTALGYNTISEKIQFVSNMELERNFSLDTRVIEIDEVIISTPFHKLQRENVMRVTRVNAEKLEQTASLNLSESLTQIPGVETISTGSGIGKPVIRGLSGNRVLTFAQGVRLENQQFGDEHGLGINAASVSSLEVIKGPASLLYGSDALGGVLYLNPEVFAQPNHTEGDLRTSYYTNTGGTATSIGARSSGSKLKFLARGGLSIHEDYRTGADYRVTNTRFKEYDFNSGLRYQAQSFTTTLRYNYNKTKVGIPESISDQSNSTTPLLPFQEIDNHILSSDNTLFMDRSSLNLKLGYIFNDRQEFEESESVPSLRMKLNTFTYDLRYQLPESGAFETITGIQGLFQTNRNTAEELLIPDADQWDAGIFGMTHFHKGITDLQLGVRYDLRKISSKANGLIADPEYIPAVDRDFQSLNAALGGKFEITDAFRIRANIASGFRAPNLAELTSNGVHEGTNRYEIGNANLNNEQNLQFDVSLEYGTEHLEMAANLFHNTVSDFIYLQPTGETIANDPVYRYIQSNAQLYGGELEAHLHPHPLDWLHLESAYEWVRGKLNNGEDLPMMPANSLINTLRVEFNEGRFFQKTSLFLNVRNVFSQNLVAMNETATPAYTLVGLGANTQMMLGKKQLQLGLNINNLTNKTYIAHLSRLKEDGIFNMGRNIQLNLQFYL